MPSRKLRRGIGEGIAAVIEYLRLILGATSLSNASTSCVAGRIGRRRRVGQTGLIPWMRIGI